VPERTETVFVTLRNTPRLKVFMQETQHKPHAMSKETKAEAKVEAERRDKALDNAIENTFPASDPISVEQPIKSTGTPAQPSSGD
jgi:hypothetical protein